ncbi:MULTISPECIES: MarR family transcriptional regulator [unclassified Micromonospora]|uniref:MarR family winged helix-turn-helix transcriptional regulator n=1 Tax=Micromonospora TaxID=1873 RepID=UPI0022B6F65A|nr:MULTISPECIES: MarR family transcriptional regulator [unclassified Micromonospora]MCZ7422031.1 MarR family transcriptional regulator [Verrucosispora sp. WMMA2121]WBB93237.1 MarR family transcriptional regulator [Verrucosispora sp. WMMC514]
MTELADTLTRQLWDFVFAYDAAYDRAAQVAGLSAAQACLLEHLPEDSRPMGELALELRCDASNVTQLVSRLEARGLVARVPDPDDRRIKRVLITSAGADVRRAVRGAFEFPSERLASLTDQEQRQLSGLLAKVLGPAS